MLHQGHFCFCTSLSLQNNKDNSIAMHEDTVVLICNLLAFLENILFSITGRGPGTLPGSGTLAVDFFVGDDDDGPRMELVASCMGVDLFLFDQQENAYRRVQYNLMSHAEVQQILGDFQSDVRHVTLQPLGVQRRNLILFVQWLQLWSEQLTQEGNIFFSVEIPGLWIS